MTAASATERLASTVLSGENSFRGNGQNGDIIVPTVMSTMQSSVMHPYYTIGMLPG